MNPVSRSIIKNLVIAAVMSLAAFASWSYTGASQPTVEIAIAQTQG